MTTGLLDGAPLYRCLHCGTRRSADGESAHLLVNCEACELVFIEDPERPASRCPACLAGHLDVDPHDGSLIEAAEAEVHRALSETCGFVGSRKTIGYLERVANEITGAIAGAPEACRIAILEDPIFRTIALPSGVIVISVGVLATLADEAELAFVLGHELAHVAAGDAAIPLVRVGLQTLAGDRAGSRAGVWTRAALDLARLGYGDRREFDADAASLRACRSLGYDAKAARRFLERLRAGNESGDPALAETALAHPTPLDRLRQLETVRNGPGDEAVCRVNRDIFRRAAGHSVIASELEAVQPFAVTGDESAVVRGGRIGSRILWTVAAVLVLATVFLLFGLL